MGRAWASYPLNVPTFRLGPEGLWRRADALVPMAGDLELAAQAARDLAAGGPAGLPPILWPSPLVLVGFLLDNPWLNRIIYRAYAQRRKCAGCLRCVRLCPTGNLQADAGGLPRATGTCCLCLGCVNLCPQGAMHLWGLTEYGRAYRPRWPEGC